MTKDINYETAVLATNSRTLAVGLTALLLSIPPIDKVECVPDVDDLLANLADAQPVLIIFDTVLTGSRTSELTAAARRLAPDSLMVILSENVAEFRELVYESQDTVIVKGTDPARLARTIETLLDTHIVA